MFRVFSLVKTQPFRWWAFHGCRWGSCSESRWGYTGCAVSLLLDRENKANKVHGGSIYILLDNSSLVLTLKKGFSKSIIVEFKKKKKVPVLQTERLLLTANLRIYYDNWTWSLMRPWVCLTWICIILGTNCTVYFKVHSNKWEGSVTQLYLQMSLNCKARNLTFVPLISKVNLKWVRQILHLFITIYRCFSDSTHKS